jgi:hypothetical protein
MRVQGPGTNEFKQFLLVKSFKLVPRPLNNGPRPKKLQIEAKPTWHLFWRENQLVWNQKIIVEGELLIWRTKNEAREQGRVQLKVDSICFKSIQIGS